MSREINFRARNIVSNEWAYGHYSENDGIACMLVHGDVDVVDVDPKTVGECTGLRDKNGVKIYEGDIVEWQQRRSVVKFRGGAFIADWDNTMDNKVLYFWGNIDRIEPLVIGNIYDNQELLENAS